jgi:uncharacterized protein (TIGR02453 family)
MSAVAGIPHDAVDFYRELAGHNTRAWWEANKARYAANVREPLSALMDALADDFGGQPSLFRPHRDVRFSADKSPYKDHQGAMVTLAAGIGYYLQVGPDGLAVGGGFYPSGPDQVTRLRAAVDAPATGAALASIVAELRAGGYEIGGAVLKTRPRGVPADHPRVQLLRHTSVTAIRAYDTPAWMATPALLQRVRSDWAACRPLVEWVVSNVGPTTLERPGPARRR